MRRGAVLAVLGTLAFTLMSACVKHARTELDTLEVILWRAGVALPIVWAIARVGGGGVALAQRKLFVLRAVLGFSAMFCGFAAARGLAVADLAFVSRLEPVFVAGIAPLALGADERPGRGLLLVLVAGLLGCGLMFGPDLQLARTGYAALAVAGAALSASAHVSIRALSATERASAIVFWFQLVTLCVAAGGLVAGTGGLPAPPPHLVPALVGSGVFAAAGQSLMTRAYQLEKATFISSLGYVAPVWALAVDAVAFGHVPAPHALAGGVVIVVASAAMMRRQRVLPSAVTSAGDAPCSSPPASSSTAAPTSTATSTRPSA